LRKAARVLESRSKSQPDFIVEHGVAWLPQDSPLAGVAVSGSMLIE